MQIRWFIICINVMPVRQQNFMIENKEFPLHKQSIELALKLNGRTRFARCFFNLYAEQVKILKVKLKSQIGRKIILSVFVFMILGFFICFICINSLSRKYTSALADAASEFAASVINADDAKNYIITRKKDDNYNEVLNSLCTYAGDSESIARISLVSFSNSAGYYIFDTDGENLGTKIDYDEYNLSVKTELINGKNKWYHSYKGSLYSYVPLRTVDDRLTGYIITEIDNSFKIRCLIFTVAGFAVLFIAGLVLDLMVMAFIEKKVFSPVEKFTEAVSEFTGSVSAQNNDTSTSVLFQSHDDNEIGCLGKAIQKMVLDINDSTKNLSEAVHEATHDGMTQVFNKRYYNNMVNEFANSSSICIIYFDVNNLKLMNDTQGHESGDYVIKQAADYIRRFTGDSSYCFRMGGDEFLFVSKNCTFNEIDRIISQLDNDAPYILSRESDKIKCALSYGYSYAKGSFSYEKLLAEAEENMYAKKTELKKLLNMPER